MTGSIGHMLSQEPKSQAPEKMFGVVASGRLVNTNVQQVDPNTFVLPLENAESINHIVVFLTGQVPFIDGVGGSIYLGWPSVDAVGSGISWQLLGFISNEKPSAVFKIAKVKPSDSPYSNPFGVTMETSTIPATQALVGVSVEPLSDIIQKTPSADTEASTIEQMTEFSQKMLENFFNYASSFAADPRQGVLSPSETYVPYSVLQNWYSNFQRKLQVNPKFWKSL